MEYKRVATCAERIKTALSIRGMKQSDLCRITQMPKSALSQYISGVYEPKQDRIYLISRALNINEAWLMGLDAPMERQMIKDYPSAIDLTEGEQMLLELFRQVPEEQQQLVLGMIRAALNTKG